MKTISIVLVSLALSGCTTAYLSSTGEKVRVDNKITQKDLKKFNVVAELTCEGKANVDYCATDLRNQAAQKGASVVRFVSTEQAYCGLDNLKQGATKSCVSVRATALNPKNM